MLRLKDLKDHRVRADRGGAAALCVADFAALAAAFCVAGLAAAPAAGLAAAPAAGAATSAPAAQFFGLTRGRE